MYRHKITEYFGEDPQYYKSIIVNGMPLKGHNGLDFAPNDFSPHDFWAIDDGTVDFAGKDNYGFGNLVRIKHTWGRSWYGHLSKVDVKVGQKVAKWQKCGLTGGTGNCNPPGFIHLHLGIKPTSYDGNNGFGGSVDPLPYLDMFQVKPPQPTGGSVGTGTGVASTVKAGNAQVVAPSGLKLKWKPSKIAPYVTVVGYGSTIEITNIVHNESGVQWRQCVLWIPESEDGEVYIKNV
jgi:hypothetical protein